MKKNTALKINNENLKTNIEELNNEAMEISTIQREQAIIAARPTLSRDVMDKWLYDCSNTPSK